MAKHNDLGKAGENAAAAYLEKEDYLIRHRNWRKGHFELDIVAAKDNELVVVEVKTRSNTEFAQPEDAVDVPKIRRTVRAADTYIKLFQIDIPVRFDIITVVGEDGNFKRKAEVSSSSTSKISSFSSIFTRLCTCKVLEYVPLKRSMNSLVSAIIFCCSS